MMKNVQAVQRQIERALAFAHAALDETTAHRVAQARVYVAEVLPQLAAVKSTALALGEARQLFEHVSQLRAVMKVLERKLDARAEAERN
jgi:hypothetical protein